MQPRALRCRQGVLRALCVTQSMGSYGRGREERRRGRACDGLWEVFFPPAQEKQFVVPSPSRKHLFPLNQQCKNGVSVWVRTREREGRWNPGVEARRALQPSAVCFPPRLCPQFLARPLQPRRAARALLPSSAPSPFTAALRSSLGNDSFL